MKISHCLNGGFLHCKILVLKFCARKCSKIHMSSAAIEISLEVSFDLVRPLKADF